MASNRGIEIRIVPFRVRRCQNIFYDTLRLRKHRNSTSGSRSNFGLTRLHQPITTMAFKNSYEYDDELEEEWPHNCDRRLEKADDCESDYPGVVADNNKLMAKCDAMKRQMEAEYASLKPILKTQVTKQECVDAGNWYLQAEIKYWSRWTSLKDPLVEELNEGVGAMNMLEETFESALGGSERPPKDLNVMWEHVQKLLKKTKEAHEAWSGFKESHGRPRSIKLQLGLQQIVQHQNAETQMWFYQNCNPYTKHLDKRPSSRPSMEIDQKAITFVPGKGGDLPLEIATTLYAQCDLETCTALRQANTFWYSCFELSENALKHKVKERNPWMKPEGDLRTWGDCALVILSRSRSYNWLCMDTIDSVRHDNSGSKKSFPVVAKPVAFGSRLHPLFEGLESHGIDGCSSLCERVHLAGDRESASLDLWKSAAHLEHEPEAEIVASQLAGNVLLYKGLCITLPGTDFLFPEDIKSVLANDSCVRVLTTSHVYLLSRDKPLHFRSGYTYTSGKFATGYAMADTHVTYATVRSRGYYGHTTIANIYSFLDFDNLRMYSYGGPNRAHPVAIYQGIIWWQTEDGRSLIPTLFDTASMENPAYRQKWIISMSQEETVPPLKQITKPGSTHLLAAKTTYGAILVDLEAREVSALYGASLCPHDKLLPGFVGSRFCLRSLDCESQRHWNKWAFDKLMGVEMPGEDEGDGDYESESEESGEEDEDEEDSDESEEDSYDESEEESEEESDEESDEE